MDQQDLHRYDDMIDLPHHVSGTHPQMSMLNRAAQFSPFAALTGYGEAIGEAGRITDRRVELTEAEKAVINEKLAAIRGRLPAKVTFTYFVPDRFKEGGRYVTETATVKQIIPTEARIALTNGRGIDLDAVLDIEVLNESGVRRGKDENNR